MTKGLILTIGTICACNAYAQTAPAGLTPDASLFAQSQALLSPAGYLNGTAAPAWDTRAALMFDDANYRGAADQLRRALREFPTASEKEQELFRMALASMHIPGSDAMSRLEEYLESYPASPSRERVLLAMADLIYDRGEYQNALQAYERVSIPSLDPPSADLCLYHKAYCLLRTGHTAQASGIYDSLAASASALSNEARFYQAYIAYAAGDYSKAADLFAKVDRSGAMPAPMADFYLCQINYRRENYAKAAAQAQRLLSGPASASPEFVAEAERIAGESLYREGKQRQALEYLERYAASCAHPQPSALYILGVEDFRNGKYQQAIDRLAPVTAEDSPIGQSAYLYIGQSYLRLGNNNAATVALEKACRLDYDRKVTETALYNLAVARAQGGKVPFGSSVALFEEFLQRYPDSEHASAVADYVVQGYMTDNNYQAALDAIRKIKHPDRNVLAAKQKVLYGLGMRQMQAGDPAAALPNLKEAASMWKYDAALAAEASLWAGECQYLAGDYAGAARTLEAYLRQRSGSDANRALASYDLGYTRFAQKNYAEAAKSFSRFVSSASSAKKNPQLMADAYNRLADCRYYSRAFAEAAGLYDTAYRTDPASGDYPAFQLGMMKGLQRDYQGKIDQLAAMMKEFPSSTLVPTALLETGESYGELGKQDRVIETYTLLSTRYPNTAQGRKGQLLLAITYLNSGNRSTAISQYKKVISRYPTSEEARLAADDLKQIYADDGNVDSYISFIESVPDAPRPETAELAALTLSAAEKAMESGRQSEALKLASEVVEKYPDSPQAVDALAIKAEVEYSRGLATEALASYRELESRASDPEEVNAARLGVMRVSRDLADHEGAIAMADKLLASSGLGTDEKNEATFTKAISLRDLGRGQEAMTLWESLAHDTDDLFGTKSAYYMALYQYDSKDTKGARRTVDALIEANPPHDYWLAKAFILLSDILRQQGDTFEADEYLRSLKENYPGTESDIFREIERRLK
ncbi:MAG: tetratricopeptide repeat protein [Muribaculaceae bacterium]|nr:tetratricopeptide repeat protein [Muribaculaceae bacterium]